MRLGRGTPPVAPAGADASTVVRFPGRTARRRRATRWGVAAAVLAVLGALGWVVFFSPVLAVDRVEVTGTRHVSAAEVQERLEPVYGVPLSRVGAGRVDELVGGLPGVAEVQTVPRLPTGLEVVVREHETRARRDGDDGVQLLLADGTVLTGVPEERLEGEDLPAFSEELAQRAQEERAEVAEVLAALPESVADRVETADSRGPGQVRLALEGGVTLVWGDAQDAGLKGSVAEAFLADERHGSAAGGVAEIDVSVPTRPITR